MEPARRFGKYELLVPIGKGGMGEIYVARKTGDPELVALKILLPFASRSDSLVAMFMDEAALMANITHPQVLAVHDFGKVDDQYFLAMELLRGQSLAKLILCGHARDDGLDHGVVSTLGAHAARGLHAAHEATKDGVALDIVHRDVSPQNIFVTYGGAGKVLDFGIARASQRLAKTSKGVFKGKASYMAPEQIEAKEPDRRTDVWALGVCLWESVAGCRLFLRDNQFKTMDAVMTAEIEAPTDVAGRKDDALDEIILRALTREAVGRYQTAGEMEAVLKAHANSCKTTRKEVAALMMKLFGDDAKEEAELLHRLRSGDEDAEVAARLRTLSNITSVSADGEIITFAGRISELEEMDGLVRRKVVHEAVDALSTELAELEERQDEEQEKTAAPAPPLAKKVPSIGILAVAAVLLIAALIAGAAYLVQPSNEVTVEQVSP